MSDDIEQRVVEKCVGIKTAAEAGLQRSTYQESLIERSKCGRAFMSLAVTLTDTLPDQPLNIHPSAY